MAELTADALVLPDVNVLVALTNPSHQHHRHARSWLPTVARFATTPVTENGLLRLLLNPTVTGQRVTGPQAVGILSRVRAHRRAVFLPDDSTLAEAEVDLIGLTGHQQATDFHLLNLAVRHSAILVTFDRRIIQTLAERDQQSLHVL